jgi:hypothetical protein
MRSQNSFVKSMPAQLDGKNRESGNLVMGHDRSPVLRVVYLNGLVQRSSFNRGVYSVAYWHSDAT